LPEALRQAVLAIVGTVTPIIAKPAKASKPTAKRRRSS
jgi:hypothetical protein